MDVGFQYPQRILGTMAESDWRHACLPGIVSACCHRARRHRSTQERRRATLHYFRYRLVRRDALATPTACKSLHTVLLVPSPCRVLARGRGRFDARIRLAAEGAA